MVSEHTRDHEFVRRVRHAVAGTPPPNRRVPQAELDYYIEGFKRYIKPIALTSFLIATTMFICAKTCEKRLFGNPAKVSIEERIKDYEIGNVPNVDFGRSSYQPEIRAVDMPEMDSKLEKILNLMKNGRQNKYLYLAMQSAESDFKVNALSQKYAYGLPQFTLETANDVAEKAPKSMGLFKIEYPMIGKDGIRYTEENPCPFPEYDWRCDPIKVTKAEIFFFDNLVKDFGDVDIALAAWNWGPEHVKDAMKDRGEKFENIWDALPQETKKFIYNVNEKYMLFNGVFPIKDKCKLSSDFGDRTRHGRYDFHAGIDISAPKGTPVYAVVSGTVANAYIEGYGSETVVIRDDFGNYHLYGHLDSKERGMDIGTRVESGRKIGKVGNRGVSTGDHLHYGFFNYPSGGPLIDVTEEIRLDEGRAVDPLKIFLREQKIENLDKLVYFKSKTPRT